jgi:hypothetical protein
VDLFKKKTGLLFRCYYQSLLEYQRRNNRLLSNSEGYIREKAEINLINSNNLLDESQRIAKQEVEIQYKTDGLIWSKGHYRVLN